MPVQLIGPLHNAFPDAANNLAQSLSNLAQQEQQRKKDAAELLFRQHQLTYEQERARAAEERQNRLDAEERQKQRQASIEAVLGHLTSGDEESARLLAQAHGAKLTSVNAPQPQRPMQAQSQQPAAPLAPMQPQQTGSPLRQLTQTVNQQAQSGGIPGQSDFDQQQQQQNDFMTAVLEHPARVQLQAQRADQFNEANQAVKSGQVKPNAGPTHYQLDFGDGQPITIDAGKLRQAHEEQRQLRQQQIQQAAGNDPELLKFLTTIEGMPPDKAKAAATFLSQRASMSEKEKMAAQYQTTADQKYRLGMANAGAHQLSAGSAAGARQDAASARAATVVDRAVANADKMVDWKGLVGMDNTMRQLISNATDKTALGHRDAQVQLGRIMRGTTPTEGEMHILYNNLGGTMDAWNRFASAFESGDVSPTVLAQMRAATRRTSEELQHRKERTFSALKTIGSNPEFQQVLPQINAQLRGRAEMVGMPWEDIQPSQASGNQGAVLLGSRAPKGKANPLVAAAQKQGGKQAPPDEAVKAAKARLSNPNETPERKEQAKKFLADYGL